MSELSVETTSTQSRLRTWWLSRAGASLLHEIVLVASLLLAYRGARMMRRTDLVEAFRHAGLIVDLERQLGVFIEDDVQTWLLGHPSLITALNHYYLWMHFPVAIGFLVWAYLAHFDQYRRIRNEMAALTFLGLVVHVLFPLAPPRMMPGFVDTMMRFGPSIYPQSALEGVSNQIAAMPSLHFGWALIAALWGARLLSTKLRLIAFLHPAIMLLAIVATANHWWLDAAVAAGIIAAVHCWPADLRMFSRLVRPFGGRYSRQSRP